MLFILKVRKIKIDFNTIMVKEYLTLGIMCLYLNSLQSYKSNSEIVRNLYDLIEKDLFLVDL